MTILFFANVKFVLRILLGGHIQILNFIFENLL